MEVEILFNYGILGLWTAVLLWEKKNYMERFAVALDRNTDILELLFNKITNRRLKKYGRRKFD